MSPRILARTLLKQAALALLCLSFLAGEAAASTWDERVIPHQPKLRWCSAEQIEPDAGTGFNPQVKMDEEGNAIATWYQFDGTRDTIWENRYEAGKGWGTAHLIETDAHKLDSHDANGEMTVKQCDGESQVQVAVVNEAGNVIGSICYEAGKDLYTVQLIETDAHKLYRHDAYDKTVASPQVAMNAAGNGVSVWEQFDGTRWTIWTKHYEAGKGWGNITQLIKTDDVGDARYPQVAVNAAGNAVAVWQQWEDTRTRWHIWAARYE